MNVFTFWEGEMPEYIKLCMKTWKFPFTVLNYENLNNYTYLPIDKLQRFTLPQIADCVRVHVLRDCGGYWLDADTIMLSAKLPKVNIMGDPNIRTNTIGYLYNTPQTIQMFNEWAEYQDEIIADVNSPRTWDIVGNRFTDPYLKKHLEVSIGNIRKRWPEIYMIHGGKPRRDKYEEFYFRSTYELYDIDHTDMLMLHNSWTPDDYKKLSEIEILQHTNCTLSNILRKTI